MQSTCLIILLLVKWVLGTSDLDALFKLKRDIEKDPAENVLVSWNPVAVSADGCPQDWFGVSCSEGHITSIILNDLNLGGKFDFSSIYGLKMLRNLSISNANLIGRVDEDVGSLVSLVYLDISRNHFVGSIPLDITHIKNLLLLNLSSNSFDGAIPNAFVNLEHLIYLDLHMNSFAGNVMGLFTQLRNVAYLDLSCNSFTGYVDLDLGHSSFVSKIRYLNISHNNLSGELFSHDGMPYFDNLEVFDASNNRFVGNIPSFNFIVSLRVLVLGTNQLSGSLPEALLQESSMVLSQLDLSLNLLQGPIGSISSSTLKYLNLSSNNLTGPLPLKIGHCVIIDVSNNMLSGDVFRIQSWGNYVEIIDLSSNSITGEFVNQASQFLRLNSLKISMNSLEGTLPSDLGTYPELKFIDFSHNKLNGTLLAAFFNSTRLNCLNLSFNNFTGSIPLQESPKDFSLISLDLSHNFLSGNLSPDSNIFNNMLNLNLSYNTLSGIVPENMRKFPESAFHPGNPSLVLPLSDSSPKSGPDPDMNMRNRSHKKSVIRAALISGLVASAFIIALLLLLSIFHRTQTKKQAMNITEKIQHQITLSVDTKADLNRQDIILGSISSPKSQIASANHSPPNKLAGDLHIFDGSLILSADELSSAPAEIIGRSCHGTLYKAVVGSGQEFAVKWLREGIAKGKKEFAREVKKLGDIKHPNLVPILGYYWGPKDHEKLILSTYINAPCLALYLHSKHSETNPRDFPPLTFNQRLKIVADVGCCLNYLHNERAIPHGNLKSSNILLQNPSLDALLTDYSLHRIMTSAGTSDQVLNSGALGYRPPEFSSTSKPCPSLKSDVYAFGVIMLELLTGKSSSEVVSGELGAVELTEWVHLLSAKNRSIECLDSQITNAVKMDRGLLKSVDDVLQIALRCILPASERPDMKTIYQDISLIVLE